ncbi:DUF3145 family protein [Leucobacter sp. UT-8R-CII-1-4]|uniref:DUF3145 family protein n=1 Tax=Leucobacter sp. UT-8R-CII-1-4 TaxID=3040075 RepID=UPI0024A8C299|nr:DUF3145 family protein [Leucobacter sp. UT-8R-CII-1-4]MDI6024263.1 DUF3145 family protein [Leucobacter sp. UT-8R-CII-1-4]
MSIPTTSAEAQTSVATGVLFVHSCPRALVPHVEWALAREIGKVVKLDWQPQPLLPNMMRTTADWRGLPRTAAAVATSLFGWQQLRFEITENQRSSGDAQRIMYTPALGIFTMQTDASGNALLTENAIRTVLDEAAGDVAAIERGFAIALGEAWDRELDPFRAAEEGDATIFVLPRLNAG